MWKSVISPILSRSSRISRNFTSMASTTKYCPPIAAQFPIPCEIVKPITDDRLYRFVELENGLGAIVISDANCDVAAAAVDVRVGSAFNPKDLQGLAHFLEHMLFLGTEKFPIESSFDKYLSNNGGGSNAYTTDTHTCYYFNISHQNLEPALEMFSEFFISPLMTESATDRELNAVDSEHKKNLQIDGWRRRQLFRHLSNPNHPTNCFSTGDLKSLRDDPISKNIDTRKCLFEFYEKYYSANVIRLCIVGRESLEELEDLVRKYFSPIKNKDVSIPYEWDISTEPIISPEKLPLYTKFVSVSPLRSLRLSWIIDCHQKTWWDRPVNYITHILGHEASGSLLSALRSRNLATELYSSCSSNYVGANEIAIDISLTESGVTDEGILEVIQLSLAAIRMIEDHKPQQWVHDELQQSVIQKFNYSGKRDSDKIVSDIASELHYVPPSLVLLQNYGDVPVFNPEAISSLLSKLTVDKLHVQLSSPDLSSSCPLTEPIYGTKYSQCSLPASWVAELSHVKASDASNNNINFPLKNVFLAKTFDILHPPSPTPYDMTNPTIPVPLEETYGNTIRASYLPDTHLGLPQTSLTVLLYDKLRRGNLFESCASRIFLEALNHDLGEKYGYYIQVSSQNVSIGSRVDSRFLELDVFTDKLNEVLHLTLDFINGYTLTESSFQLAQQKLLLQQKHLIQNEAAYMQAISQRVRACCSPTLDQYDVLNQLTNTSYAECQAIFRKMLSAGIFLEVLLVGNVNQEIAERCCQIIHEKFNYKKLDALLPEYNIPPGDGKRVRFVKDASNPNDFNSAVNYSLPIGDRYNEKDVALASVMTNYYSQLFFNDLRTKQQLGYVASCRHSENGELAFNFIVMSAKKSAGVLRTRIEAFIDEMRESVDTLTDAEFQKLVQAALSNKTQRPTMLNHIFNNVWPSIIQRTYDFYGNSRVIESLKQVTLKEFVVFVKKAFAPLDERSAIAVEVEAVAKEQQVIEDTDNVAQEQSDGMYVLEEDPIAFALNSNNRRYITAEPFCPIPCIPKLETESKF